MRTCCVRYAVICGSARSSICRIGWSPSISLAWSSRSRTTSLTVDGQECASVATLAAMYDADTIPKLLERGAANDPALGAPGREALRYQALRVLSERTAHALNAMGIGYGDRVAIVLPNGPEMASAFLTIGSAATAAPLNPGYRESEFDFYLSDLDAKALVILDGMDSPARTVAASRGVPIVELVADPAKLAGDFSLRPPSSSTHSWVRSGAANADDVALILHTSGTTSRPKMVPLSHRNVSASAVNIARTLRLTREDVCLNIMPLFHIHGLIGAVLSSIGVGASIAC